MEAGRDTTLRCGPPTPVPVHLVGDFNGWNPEVTPMTQLAQSGIWECFIPGMAPGELYKFAVTTQSGKILFKADPYANCAEYRPGTASMTTDIEAYRWTDGQWMEKRSQSDPVTRPHEHL